jgi:ArsR family transcriptional regulator, arsenate/arsenite/antimonite-responsive transcriptional repressor
MELRENSETTGESLVDSDGGIGDDTGKTIQRVFNALSSPARRKVLAYLSASSLTAGEIADRFDMAKPSVSQHLAVLESAGLIAKEKRGQFVHYSLVENNLVNTLNGFVQEVCPIGRPIRRESRALANAGQKHED